MKNMTEDEYLVVSPGPQFSNICLEEAGVERFCGPLVRIAPRSQLLHNEM